MRFAEPGYLAFLLVPFFFLIFFRIVARRNRRRWRARRCGDLGADCRFLRENCAGAPGPCGSSLCFHGLCPGRPPVGLRMAGGEDRGREIIFALDTSKSMLAADIKPSRLERAKLAIKDLVAHGLRIRWG